MNLDNLFRTFSLMHPISEEFKQGLQKEIVSLSLPKNYLLQEAPRISDHAYYIDKGFAMSFTYIKGKRHVEKFWQAGDIVVSAKSFFEQKPSQEYIQLLQESEVLFISYPSVMKMFERFPEANAISRAVMNKYLEHARQARIDLQYLNSIERYVKLRTNFPRIEQIVPQEYLASYIGIAPQSLSRLKKRFDY